MKCVDNYFLKRGFKFSWGKGIVKCGKIKTWINDFDIRHIEDLAMALLHRLSDFDIHLDDLVMVPTL